VSGCQVVAINIEEKVRAVAFVTVAENKAFSERAIIEHCRQGLAGYKVPARVFVLNEFPVTRSANGTKIQRARLREWAEAQVNER
jgi:fatty-acyl-CoA synthase